MGPGLFVAFLRSNVHGNRGGDTGMAGSGPLGRIGMYLADKPGTSFAKGIDKPIPGISRNCHGTTGIPTPKEEK